MKLFLNSLLIAAAAILLTTNAFAHAIWIEKGSEPQLNVFFGEYGDGIREKSGGKLDDVNGLEGWVLDAKGNKQAAQIETGSDRFIIKGDASGAIVQNMRVPVKDMTKYNIGIAKPFYYARLAAASDSSPILPLDMLASADQKSAQVFFEGKPLAQEKVIVTAPNGWSREIKTDDEGRIALDLPWAGLYVLEVIHSVEKKGSYEGKDYALERHRMTLSLSKA